MIHPNPDRLRSYVAGLTAADVGGTPGGGVNRPAASDEDKAVRDRFTSLASDLGLEVRMDDVGNMYAHRQGTDPGALPVVIGSHLDTVVPGGKYDGILGVAVALEVIASLKDHDITTQRPIVVVNWTGEEGARFPPAMLGSGVVTGAWDIEYAHSRRDAEGLALGEELDRIGYLGERENRLGEFFASLEVHIEQGTHLEQQDKEVGIVSRIEPVRWSTVRVQGPGGHAGSQRVSERSECAVAAARMIVTARDLARQEDAFRTTVGRFELTPGSNNVVPHQAEFNLDLRSSDDERVEQQLAELTRRFEVIADEEGVAVSVENYWGLKGASFHPGIFDLLKRTSQQRDIRWMETVGTIGHDSVHLAQRGPTAMLFTRTVGGLSHCEEEDVPWESTMATAEVFVDTALTLAQTDSLDQLADHKRRLA